MNSVNGFVVLAELLSKMTIIHTSVALQPRGLVNRANWCYINGVSFNNIHRFS